MGFVYQPLFILVVLISWVFLQSWRHRWVLFANVLGSIILIDFLIAAVFYLFVTYKVPGLAYLRWEILWLPIVVPGLVWYFTEKKLRSSYDGY